jgi:hypothetical protein
MHEMESFNKGIMHKVAIIYDVAHGKFNDKRCIR